VFGLGLALIGLYGIVSFAILQRRRDIAVHVAMGALPSDVMRLVLSRELRLSASAWRSASPAVAESETDRGVGRSARIAWRKTRVIT
jgi:hypothetical protein